MQQTLTAGQAAPLIFSAAERIEQSCRELHDEAANLKAMVSQWLSTHKEVIEDCVAVPAMTVFGVVMYLMVAVLQGGAA